MRAADHAGVAACVQVGDAGIIQIGVGEKSGLSVVSLPRRCLNHSRRVNANETCMSVHTYISARITDLDSLIELLGELGLSWEDATVSDPLRGLAVNAIGCVIGGEYVYICQWRLGEPFRFLWDKPSNSRIVETIANLTVEEVQEQRAINAQQQAEAARIAELRRQEEQERARLEEAERQRMAEEQRRIESERQRVEEQERQEQLTEEAGDLLSRLDAEQEQAAKAAAARKPKAPPPAAPASPPSSSSVEQMDRLIGKLHQTDALRKIREHLPELKEKFEATLEREEIFDDETVELRLTM